MMGAGRRKKGGVWGEGGYWLCKGRSHASAGGGRRGFKGAFLSSAQTDRQKNIIKTKQTNKKKCSEKVKQSAMAAPHPPSLQQLPHSATWRRRSLLCACVCWPAAVCVVAGGGSRSSLPGSCHRCGRSSPPQKKGAAVASPPPPTAPASCHVAVASR